MEIVRKMGELCDFLSLSLFPHFKYDAIFSASHLLTLSFRPHPKIDKGKNKHKFCSISIGIHYSDYANPCHRKYSRLDFNCD